VLKTAAFCVPRNILQRDSFHDECNRPEEAEFMQGIFFSYLDTAKLNASFAVIKADLETLNDWTMALQDR
jgi:hypothetical protein